MEQVWALESVASMFHTREAYERAMAGEGSLYSVGEAEGSRLLIWTWKLEKLIGKESLGQTNEAGKVLSVNPS